MSLTQKLSQMIVLSSLIFGSFIPTAFSASVPQEDIQQTKSQTLLAQSTVNRNGFKVQINNCRRSNSKVICSVLIRNTTNKNRAFIVYGSGSRAIDFSGNVYEVSKIKFGNKTGGYHRVPMTPDIPVKLDFYFSIPQGVNQLAGIELKQPYTRIGFRNVPIGNYRSVKDRHNCQ